LRRYTALKIDLTWPEENAQGAPRLDDPTALEMLDSASLSPSSKASIARVTR
jgi:hypothetical protein